MISRALLIIGFFLSLSLTAQQERQAENWHFSGEIVVSFAGGGPVLDPPSAMNAFEGAVSLSDTDGNLLFYTNGGGQGFDGGREGVIWNRDNDVLYDMGNTEGGGWSARQSCIAMPSPSGQEGIYYLFTVDDNENTTLRPPGNGLRVFILDMNANDGLGGVILADSLLLDGATEALDATPTADGTGYWVMTVIASPTEPRSGIVRLTPEGISEPVLADLPTNGQRVTFSPDGNYLFIGDDLYAFDKEDGTLGSLVSAYPENNISGPGFTTDSRFLYLIEGQAFRQATLVRYDLSDQTRLEVAELAGEDVLGHNAGNMQLGPNGNLYFVESTITAPGTPSIFGLSEIVCSTGEAPQVNRELIPLTGVGSPQSTANVSLPQFVDAIFREVEQSDTTTAAVKSIELCEGSETTLVPESVGESYAWSSGDTTATLTVTEAGVYTATITDGCEVTIESFEVTLGASATNLSLVATDVEGDEICNERGATLRLAGPGSDTLQLRWFDGSTADTLRVVLDPAVTYSVTVLDPCGEFDLELSEAIAEVCSCEAPIFPEVISANRDGTNDDFRGFTDCPVDDYELVIFNRWGQEVFSSSDPMRGWDGTRNGQPQNLGTYLYRSRYRLDGEDEPREVNGQFALVR